MKVPESYIPSDSEAPPLKPVAASDEATPLDSDSKDGSGSWSSYISFTLVGPGLLVCLADTDAGCLMVAAKSGAVWGYSLLLLQIVLIPILFFAQELTVRLGIYTRMGLAGCIKQRCGSFWGWTTTIVLGIECTLAMMSEISGIDAVMQIWGMNRLASSLVAVLIVGSVVSLCKYRQIETVGIVLGLFELIFVVTMFCFHPSVADVFGGLVEAHFNQSGYLELLASNIGAVIMPWMLYFQQSAVVARRLTSQDLKAERGETLVGSILTQLIMIGTLITYAASRTKTIETTQEMVTALEPALGVIASKIMVSLALLGGSLCAAFVVSMAASWAICEAFGWEEALSLDEPPTKAPRFYVCFFAVIAASFTVLQLTNNIVNMNVFVNLIDGLLLPFALGFLFLLASSDMLPPGVRLTGWYQVMLGVLFGVCSLVGLVTGIIGLATGRHEHRHIALPFDVS